MHFFQIKCDGVLTVLLLNITASIAAEYFLLIFILGYQMFSARTQRVIKRLVVVASTRLRWSVAKRSAGSRYVVVELFAESQ